LSGKQENPSGRQRATCKATRKDGQPCTAPAVMDGFCIGHCPQATEARRKGGRNSSRQARLDAMLPARLRPVLDSLEKAMSEVYSGELDPRQAQAMSSLARAMVVVLEVSSLEERVRRLEERLEAKR